MCVIPYANPDRRGTRRRRWLIVSAFTVAVLALVGSAARPTTEALRLLYYQRQCAGGAGLVGVVYEERPKNAAQPDFVLKVTTVDRYLTEYAWVDAQPGRIRPPNMVGQNGLR